MITKFIFCSDQQSASETDIPDHMSICKSTNDYCFNGPGCYECVFSDYEGNAQCQTSLFPYLNTLPDPTEPTYLTFSHESHPELFI